MPEDSEFELGKMLFLLSKAEDEPLPRLQSLSDEDVAAGWTYFASISDISGGVNLETFQAQVKKMVKRILKEMKVDEQISMFGMMAIGTFVHSEEEAREKVSKLTNMILDKMLEATPCFAKAVFRFFGENAS